MVCTPFHIERGFPRVLGLLFVSNPHPLDLLEGDLVAGAVVELGGGARNRLTVGWR